MAGIASRRRKESNDVDEEEIQFGSVGGGGCRAGGLAAGVGGRGAAFGTEPAEQQPRFDQPVNAEPVGPVHFTVDAEPLDSVCSAVDAAEKSAFAQQQWYHVETFDEPEPFDQPAHRSALSAQDAGQSQQLVGLAEQEFLAEPDPHAESVSEHQSVHAESVHTQGSDPLDAEPLLVGAESVRTEDSGPFDPEPVVVDTIAQDADGAATAIVQPAESAESAAYAFDDAGGSYPESSVDRVERPDAHDVQANGSFDTYADAVSVAERTCDATIGQHGGYTEAQLHFGADAFGFESIGHVEPGSVQQHRQPHRHSGQGTRHHAAGHTADDFETFDAFAAFTEHDALDWFTKFEFTGPDCVPAQIYTEAERNASEQNGDADACA